MSHFYNLRGRLSGPDTSRYLAAAEVLCQAGGNCCPASRKVLLLPQMAPHGQWLQMASWCGPDIHGRHIWQCCCQPNVLTLPWGCSACWSLVVWKLHEGLVGRTRVLVGSVVSVPTTAFKGSQKWNVKDWNDSAVYFWYQNISELTESLNLLNTRCCWCRSVTALTLQSKLVTVSAKLFLQLCASGDV